MEGFDTTSRRRKGAPGMPQAGGVARHRPKIVVGVAVVLVLIGAAFYNARLSESAPKVVYTASLEEAVQEAQAPLLVNINTADAEELDELPQVGPSTAEEIIAYRETNGPFRTVDDLEAVPGIGPKTLEEIRPFATV
jgi:competence protein ComEA